MIDRDSSELLRALDVLSMPAFIVDKEWTILSCNDNVHAFFDYDRVEVIGRNLDKFISLDNLLRERESTALSPSANAATAGEASSSLRSFCFPKNGSPMASRIAVIPRRNHRPDRMIIAVRDAPGQKAALAETGSKLYRESSTQGELINELSSIINSSLSIGTIFRMVVSELRKIIDYSRASLLLYNEKDDNLLIFALDTEMKTVMKKGVKAPIEGTSAGWVVRNNKPWISYDLNDTAFPLDRKLLREGIRSTISIPLFHDRMLGVFNFDSTEPVAVLGEGPR